MVFGPGALAQLDSAAAPLSLRRALIVSDPILQRLGMIDQVLNPLRRAQIECQVFAESEPEPSLAVAERCVAFARPFQPDAIVGLGGGSNLDLAKIVATVLAHGGAARDYIGDGAIPGPVLPIIAIPTTAGTGSEVTAAAVLTDAENQMKVGVLSNFLRPRLAIVDPLLTLTCPAKVTADSGIDALTHAIEAFTAVDNETFPLPSGQSTVYQGRHPFGNLFAEKAIELVGRFLVRAVRKGDDLEARSGMALAATMGGLAFSNVGVALVHAMEYPVGGAVHCSHGLGNGLLLPYVMRFNLPSRKKEFARIAQLLGEDVARISDSAGAEQAIRTIEWLKRECGIPERLREIGVTAEQLPQFAEKASSIQRILRVNPRPVSTADCLAIYQAAY
jgi:alcohol dehydrogenase class IV